MRVTCANDTELEHGLLIALDGRLDAHGATQLWQSVSERIDEQHPIVLLDLNKVQMLTSAGIGILVRMLSRTQSKGGSMSVFGCSESVLRVLEVVQCKEVLQVRDDLAATREAVGG